MIQRCPNTVLEACPVSLAITSRIHTVIDKPACQRKTNAVTATSFRARSVAPVSKPGPTKIACSKTLVFAQNLDVIWQGRLQAELPNIQGKALTLRTRALTVGTLCVFTIHTSPPTRYGGHHLRKFESLSSLPRALVAMTHRKPGKVRARPFRLKRLKAILVPADSSSSVVLSAPILSFLAPSLHQCGSAVHVTPLSFHFNSLVSPLLPLFSWTMLPSSHHQA